jgi:hypothetical protein
MITRIFIAFMFGAGWLATGSAIFSIAALLAVFILAAALITKGKISFVLAMLVMGVAAKLALDLFEVMIVRGALNRR